MKNRLALVAVFALSLTGVQGAWGQWSSNPAVNLPLSDMVNADQVQPKIRPLPDGQWYVSWFNSDANDAPPIGYDVYYQRLSPGGVEKFAHDGARIATLSNSSTEDYGLDIDTNGNALLAFLDTRESANQQVTAVKMDKQGYPLWGRYGVQLTKGSNGHYSPRITGTSDGGVVVAWTEVGNSTAQVMIQKLDHNGHLLWPSPVVLQATGVNYNLADLHAADNGSVIISWEFDTGFFGNKQLATNKLSSGGKKLWGKNNVALFSVGSLQFGEFPYFILDGSGGAVFAWYTAYPTLQVFAQHIRANGTAAFPQGGSAGSININNVHVEPSVSYRASSDETFLFWTEEDSNQFYNGVSGQKFDGNGVSQWAPTGLVVVPLGPQLETETFVKNVQVGSGALVMWVNSPTGYTGTIQAIRLGGAGKVVCPQFAVASTTASQFGLSAATGRAGMAAVAWADNRIGNNSIYIQNVNSDCTLGVE
jgi:hypothetical protein